MLISVHFVDIHESLSYRVCISQCSTVVRNTVVRATIKVNGKPQIWAPVVPESLNQST